MQCLQNAMVYFFSVTDNIFKSFGLNAVNLPNAYPACFQAWSESQRNVKSYTVFKPPLKDKIRESNKSIYKISVNNSSKLTFKPGNKLRKDVF